jgi:hypothetical protein
MNQNCALHTYRTNHISRAATHFSFNITGHIKTLNHVETIIEGESGSDCRGCIIASTSDTKYISTKKKNFSLSQFNTYFVCATFLL